MQKVAVIASLIYLFNYQAAQCGDFLPLRGEDNSLFLTAVWDNNLRTAELLLDQYPKLALSKNEHGITILMSAVFWGYNDMVKLLLAKGAPVNIQDDKGQTALMYAAMKGDLELVKLLVENWAALDLMDKEGKSALVYAISSGHRNVEQYLISQGAIVPQQGWWNWIKSRFK